MRADATNSRMELKQTIISSTIRRKPTAEISASKSQAHKAANSYQVDFGEDEILKL